MKRFGALGTASIATVFVMAGFARTSASAQENGQKKTGSEVYVAHLQPLNTKTTGLQTAGEARFTIDGDRLTISIQVHNAPHDTVHWQHFHGFKDGRGASCPTATADKNHDGVIDVVETEPMSGTTMVPFDKDPVEMDVALGAYPKASGDGAYEYREVVSLKDLEAAFEKAFPGQHLDLDRRVVMIHGVPTARNLPVSVATLGPIPPQITLPIACGKIERVDRK